MSKKHLVQATIFDKRGRILAVAQNQYQKSHPWQKELGIKAGGRNVERIYLHAEVAAIIRAMKKGKPHSIRIERYKANGEPGNACPCPICQLAIKEAGIQEVTFTMG